MRNKIRNKKINYKKKENNLINFKLIKYTIYYFQNFKINATA